VTNVHDIHLADCEAKKSSLKAFVKQMYKILIA